MKSLGLAIALLSIPFSLAFAQQPTVSPSNIAVQIDNAVNAMALNFEQAIKTNEELQKQIDELKKQCPVGDKTKK